MQGPLWTIFRYEIAMLLRDTRTLLIAVVAPLVLFPLFIFVTNRVDEREEQRLEEAVYSYAVVGSEAEWARMRVERALLGDTVEGRSRIRFAERREEDPDAALQSGDLELVVESFTGDEYRALLEAERDSAMAALADSAAARQEAAQLPPEPVPPVPARALRLRYRADSDFSRRARDRLADRLREDREAERDSLFMARGFPVPVEEVIPVEFENVASPQKEGGAVLGLILTPALLLLMLTGGSIVAVDAISGEKERGTLETLLTTAASRGEIVWAKLLAVIVVGLAVAAVNVANLSVYLGLGLLDLPPSLAIDLDPGRIIVLFLLFVPLAVVVAAALLLLSGVSKSYREYQIYFFPVLLVFILPAAAPVLPGMELRSAIALVPIAGLAVAVREMLLGPVDLLFTALAFLTTTTSAIWLALLTERTLSNERLISRQELDEADLLGGAALFPRHVLRWFLGLWVVFFIVSLWFGDSLGVRGQILVNLVGIFLGGSLFLIHRYDLPVRETLSLRMPHPAAWLAALVGAPSALILGMGLAELVDAYLFPVPEAMLEAFAESLTEPEMGMWQLLLFLSIMPGVLEEIAFRGVLLSGVRKRMGPWRTALVVGAVFGFFHVSLFRILPTAWLGVILAGVVLLSGSLLPAILWHLLNNALAIVPGMKGWVPEDFEPSGWIVAASAAGLAFSFWLLWTTRPDTTPSPTRGRARASAGPDPVRESEPLEPSRA
ncbi:MAG: ABC transporter permease subunit [Gemmatimonadota bacterium]